MGANVVFCTRIEIGMVDYEGIHFEGGSAISGAGVLVFEMNTYVQSSQVSFGSGYTSQ